MITVNVATAHASYATYMHSVAAPGADKSDVIYIGTCKTADLIASPDARRNSKWRELVKAYPSVTIAIAAEFDNEPSAMQYANQLIELFKPICNATGIVARRGGAVVCVDTEQEFPNAAAACKFFDIATSAMSNHLNGLPGYNMVRGMRFRRI